VIEWRLTLFLDPSTATSTYGLRMCPMCFGPISNFSTGAVLSFIGTATFTKVRAKKELFFAAIPLLFSIQIVTEGFLWLVLIGKAPSHWEQPLALAFLFFAYWVWPVFTPISIYFLEPTQKRKKIFLLLFLVGIGTAAYLLFLLFTHPLKIYIMNHSLRYETIPQRPYPLLLYYLAATVGPYFASSWKPLAWLGVLNLFFCVVAYYLYSKTFDSIWCYFAAIASAGIYLFIRWLHRNHLAKKD
jgi:hypothetical protein